MTLQQSLAGATALPPSPLQRGAEDLLVAAFLLLLGYLVTWLFTRRLSIQESDRWGLAPAGLSLFFLVTMLIHIGTGGMLIANEWLMRGMTIGVAGILAVARLMSLGRLHVTKNRLGKSLLMVVVVAVATVFIWGLPVMRVSPLDFGGDTGLHSGWGSQLLDGETTPSAAITGRVPNFYPWLFHAAEAITARITPGGRVLEALGTIQLVLVSGTLLALFALGRAITKRTAGGFAAALLAGLAGGFGFLLAQGPALVLDPRVNETRYWGDFLFTRSYNPSFYNLAPPFPRDLAYMLLLCALSAAVLGLRNDSMRLMVGAGVSLGMTGLSNAESFFLGCAVFAALVAFPTNGSRKRVFFGLLVPALAVYSIWALPQLVSYLRLGGYVNLTVVGPVTLPAGAIVFGWGIITPLAILGIATSWRSTRSDPGRWITLLVIACSGLFIVLSSLVPRILGQPFATLGRAHRYWPLMGLGLALCGARGLVWINNRVPTKAVPILWLVAIGLAVPSPVLASTALSRFQPAAPLGKALAGDDHALLNVISPAPGGRCVVAAPKDVVQLIWTYTGYRMVMFWASLPHPDNPARIRWKQAYEQTVPLRRRKHDNRILIRGTASLSRWRHIAKTYGVDVVVARDSAVRSGRGFPLNGVRVDDGPYTVFRIDTCPP